MSRQKGSFSPFGQAKQIGFVPKRAFLPLNESIRESLLVKASTAYPFFAQVWLYSLKRLDVLSF